MAATGRAERRSRADASAPARREIYVWELPVRLVHWTIVLSLVILSATGYYIYDPFLQGTGSTGDPGFLMGWVRFLHETCGFVFTAAVLARIYWAFAGNRYARWRVFLPLTRAQRRDLVDMLRFYALRRRDPPAANGHNPLAALAYLAVYGMFFLSIISGFGLYAWASRIPAWRTLFGWTYGALPIEQLRLVHFLLMFAFAAFTLHHVYSAILVDLEEHNGELSSIVTGYKTDLQETVSPDDEPSTSR